MIAEEAPAMKDVHGHPHVQGLPQREDTNIAAPLTRVGLNMQQIHK